MSLKSLRQHVQTYAEHRPGIYRMYGPSVELLYVGKSVRVRSRVLSYFRAPSEEKGHRLIRGTARLDWEYVPNEFAALIREMKLIQRHRPAFSVRHESKRMYAFVKLTRERAPRILPVTRVAHDDALYFGPFPRVGQVARTVREPAHVIGFATALAPPRSSSTINWSSSKADALRSACEPTWEAVRRPAAGAPLRSPTRSACARPGVSCEGKTRKPLEKLEAEMTGASRRMDFEYAALLRDRLERLDTFQKQLAAFRGRVRDLSFLYRVPGFNGTERLYLIRQGRICREFAYPRRREARERVAAAIDEVFSSVEPGPAALEPHEAAEILLVARWFRLNKKEGERTVEPGAWLEKEGLLEGSDPASSELRQPRTA